MKFENNLLPKMTFIRNKRKQINELQIQNRRFNLKQTYNPVIPLKVYMTWHTKNLPPKMRDNVNFMKQINPEFEFCIYDDNDCINFIKEHFEPDVLWAFNKLIPGAYKADLWRLCVLYINGGIYLDIKLRCLNGFKLIELSEDEHLVWDRPYGYILNSIMVCKAGNMFLRKCIDEIINNVKNKNYGFDMLSPTGPGLLGKVLKENNFILNVDLRLPQHGEFVVYKGVGVFRGYGEYVNERSSMSKTNHYGDLWNIKNIYN